MEQNTSVMAKKIWNIMRVAFFLLRNGICKRKILMDLNLIIKRGKIAGKALQNLMSNHGHGSNPEASTVGQSNPPGEYEFSCSNTPLYRHYFTTNKRKNHHNNTNYFTPSPFEGMNNIEDIKNIFDIMMSSSSNSDAMTSPVLPGLSGLNRGVRQLRITDSPFPVENIENGSCNNKHVDVAAEDFINKFYSQLKSQKN